ncbi:hypothetical protein PoB_007554900 [Plakobranchus ocellatus]|uniref:Uncharacterized protein n=1 Tax=Plakobranchus ocellatus TaxID=259542 RepID=A0AAV4DXW2_9GAST|nr:hypothetical protein PoB_007554900 [Plakobranchus ocellatus]
MIISTPSVGKYRPERSLLKMMTTESGLFSCIGGGSRQFARAMPGRLASSLYRHESVLSWTPSLPLLADDEQTARRRKASRLSSDSVRDFFFSLHVRTRHFTSPWILKRFRKEQGM